MTTHEMVIFYHQFDLILSIKLKAICGKFNLSYYYFFWRVTNDQPYFLFLVACVLGFVGVVAFSF